MRIGACLKPIKPEGSYSDIINFMKASILNSDATEL